MVEGAWIRLQGTCSATDYLVRCFDFARVPPCERTKIDFLSKNKVRAEGVHHAKVRGLCLLSVLLVNVRTYICILVPRRCPLAGGRRRREVCLCPTSVRLPYSCRVPIALGVTQTFLVCLGGGGVNCRSFYVWFPTCANDPVPLVPRSRLDRASAEVHLPRLQPQARTTLRHPGGRNSGEEQRVFVNQQSGGRSQGFRRASQARVFSTGKKSCLHTGRSVLIKFPTF